MLTASSHKVLNLMPCPTQKAANTKLQRKNAKNTFNFPQHDSDSGSVYNPPKDEVSSDESVTATKKLYSSLQLALMYVPYSKGLNAVQTAFAMKKYNLTGASNKQEL